MIEVVEAGGELAVVVRRRWRLDQMRVAQQEARAILDIALKDQRELAGDRFTMWSPPQNGFIDYAPGVVVQRQFAPTPGATFLTLPRGRCALLRLRGSFEGLQGAWQSLFDGCAEQELVPAGLNWEVYAAPGAEGADLYALLA